MRSKARKQTKRSDVTGADVVRYAVFSNSHVRVATTVSASAAEKALSKHNAKAKTPGWMQQVKDVRLDDEFASELHEYAKVAAPPAWVQAVKDVRIEGNTTWVLHESLDRTS